MAFNVARNVRCDETYVELDHGALGTDRRSSNWGEVQICNVKDLLLTFPCDALGRGNVKFATSKLLKTCFYHFHVMPWGGGMSHLHRQNC